MNEMRSGEQIKSYFLYTNIRITSLGINKQ